MDDEARLIKQARGDADAFGQLYDRYVDRIYSYACRELGDPAAAQDVVSATFEKALRHIGRYQDRGHSFGAWLYRIARNEMMMIYRRRKWLAPLLGLVSADGQMEQALEQKQRGDAVRAAMARLRGRDQEILRLRFDEELDNAEIAQVLNCTGGTAATRLSRALARLRQQMTPTGQEAAPDVTSG